MRVLALLSLLAAAITVPSSVSAWTVSIYNITDTLTTCDQVNATTKATSTFVLPAPLTIPGANFSQACLNIDNNGGSILLNCGLGLFQYTPFNTICPANNVNTQTLDFLTIMGDAPTSAKCYQGLLLSGEGGSFMTNPQIQSKINTNVMIRIDCSPNAPTKAPTPTKTPPSTASTVSTITAAGVALVSAVAAKFAY